MVDRRESSYTVSPVRLLLFEADRARWDFVLDGLPKEEYDRRLAAVEAQLNLLGFHLAWVPDFSIATALPMTSTSDIIREELF